VSISTIFYEQLFNTKVFCAAFMCLLLGIEIFWQKDFGAKAANKMLVKLAPGDVIFVQLSFPLSATIFCLNLEWVRQK